MKIKAVFLALIAAVFFALNVPFSKILLDNVEPTFMAGFLYLGAGVEMSLRKF
ncbi:MAG: EamA family transporter [Synergistaceae bacterium]|nr:EamA family transporter [Synergistaceae bacterium]MBR0080192.1 EamA family transporter [Synergistaceae bacterium]MBR0234009.1 EamA family transporter [Synergistaceae bacterium]